MGFVYLLECSNDDSTIYKIGYTKKSVTSRIKNLQTGSAYQIKELYSYKTSYKRKLETTLHNLYKHKNIKNEWFNLDINDIATFHETCARIEKSFDALKENPFFK